MSNKKIYQSIEHQLPIFFKSWWLDTVCASGWDVAILIKDKVVIAVWPYQIEQKLRIKLLRNPLLTPYLGPYFLRQEEANENDLQNLWLQLPKTGLRQWTIFPEIVKESFFRQFENYKENKLTHYLDLTKTVEELWKDMHPTCRNAIRKGQQSVIVSECPINIDQFIRWNADSFNKKNKKFPYNYSFLNGVTSAASSNNSSLCYQAKDCNGLPIGVLWLVYDNTKIYYLLGGINKESNRGTMALLVWTAIQKAQSLGLKIFDFEGSVDVGIARFFKRFGAMPVPYAAYNVVYSSLWKLKLKIKN